MHRCEINLMSFVWAGSMAGEGRDRQRSTATTTGDDWQREVVVEYGGWGRRLKRVPRFGKNT